MAEHFHFEIDGKPWFLNGYHIGRQGIDEAGCQTIAALHNVKQICISDMEACSKWERKLLHQLYDTVRSIEYDLQAAWGFPQDSNWHRHWEVPHCICFPRMNKLIFPQQSIFNDGCPVHGK